MKSFIPPATIYVSPTQDSKSQNPMIHHTSSKKIQIVKNMKLITTNSIEVKRLIQAATRQLCNRITNPKILVQNNKYQGNDLDERGINQDKESGPGSSHSLAGNWKSFKTRL